jgi:SAM-dependent methyltransferase
MYSELAGWWHLISPPEDYAGEAAFAAEQLRRARHPVREVLELGSGGGNTASHLKAHFAMTLVDLSPGMLAASQQLNPECEHHLGDMRDVRLGRRFDAVFVHDAVMYLTTEHDLRRAFATAYEHCRPGGVAVFEPDCTTETFEPSTSHEAHDGVDGRSVRYLEWSWDPDPSDTEARTDYAFLLREAGGEPFVVHDTHRWGLFSRATWLALLADVGFDAEAVPSPVEACEGLELFVAHRP